MKKKHPTGSFIGPSQRQLKVGEILRRSLSDIFLRGDLHDVALSRFNITIGEVRVSPDLRNATVYFLPLGGEYAEEARKLLNKNKKEIRFQLSKKIALKFSPDLVFQIDHTFDNVEQSQKLFSNEKFLQDIQSSSNDVK